MKNSVVLLLLFTTFITGCDRDTLSGLNLKINAEVKSDYEEETTATEGSSETQVETKSVTQAETKSETEKSATTKIINVRETDDPDAPLAFKEIQECSKAYITAKTNEKFYAKNSQLKSLDSKNEEQLKEWKQIYQEIEKGCN